MKVLDKRFGDFWNADSFPFNDERGETEDFLKNIVLAVDPFIGFEEVRGLEEYSP